jgi:hypothetical protein
VTLHEILAQRTKEWRDRQWTDDSYPAVAELLEWANAPYGSGFTLRPPQLAALETYWHLRLQEDTPRILDLYRRLYPRKTDLVEALGIPNEAFRRVDYDLEPLMQAITQDDAFAKEFNLDALRETLSLTYPSYILALAMGAGKTALIGAIYATEFAMAMEYPDGPFVQNALVFAPGLTIIESLRELLSLPYDRILPPRLHKQFAASVKMTFTREGEKDIPVIEKSLYNVVVTNAEKIRIQKERVTKGMVGSLFGSAGKLDEARAEVANARLRKIASLPHLAIFSDEAHHTYGQALGTELKKVRKTVDYLARETKVVCVVNTTGTPYFQRQPLRDVVIWYGLSRGIHDGILKEVANNIKAYTFDDANASEFVGLVVEDFVRDYWGVALPDGTPAKLAMYFPQTDDVDVLRPAIEARLAALGIPSAVILRHDTSDENKESFDRFRTNTEHRIALLVNRGTEGWDVPALYACALARQIKSSRNFVLQAACRCLRQVPGNQTRARIYLSADNRATLDRELQETYGESIADLNRQGRTTATTTIRLRKLNIPPLVVRELVRTITPVPHPSAELKLCLPDEAETRAIEVETLTAVSDPKSTKSVLQVVGTEHKELAEEESDIYTAAVELAVIYRLDLWSLYDELRRLYPGMNAIPHSHLRAIRRQLEELTCKYEVKEEKVERALALVKLAGFAQEEQPDGTVAYTAEISYPVDRANLLATWDAWKDRANGLAFHYDPYNFDSNPEQNFLEQLLALLKQNPAEVEDIYYTGAITDPKKTDFYIEYKGEDEQMHRYSPDFIVRRKDGKCLIVEIKDARFESAVNEDLARDEGQAAVHPEGRKAVALSRLQRLNPDRLKYEVIFAKGDAVDPRKVREVQVFVEEP